MDMNSTIRLDIHVCAPGIYYMHCVSFPTVVYLATYPCSSVYLHPGIYTHSDTHTHTLASEELHRNAS